MKGPWMLGKVSEPETPPVFVPKLEPEVAEPEPEITVEVPVLDPVEEEPPDVFIPPLLKLPVPDPAPAGPDIIVLITLPELLPAVPAAVPPDTLPPAPVAAPKPVPAPDDVKPVFELIPVKLPWELKLPCWPEEVPDEGMTIVEGT